jgi:hypothetical protein
MVNRPKFERGGAGQIKIPSVYITNEKSITGEVVPQRCWKQRLFHNVQRNIPDVSVRAVSSTDSKAEVYEPVINIKLSLYQAVEAHRVVRRRGFHRFYTIG